MKFSVTIEGVRFDVNVGDLDARPIVAAVDGERFEVWPEGSTETVSSPSVAAGDRIADSGPAPVRLEQPPRLSPRTTGQAGLSPAGNDGAVFAPIPGVVESIAVRAGDHVELGQELIILEAMKMKNVIRASRPGEIDSVLVLPGQHVKHHDLLIKYSS